MKLKAKRELVKIEYFVFYFSEKKQFTSVLSTNIPSPHFLINTLITKAIHELTHALGFSSSLFNTYLNENGTVWNPSPLATRFSTARNKNVTEIITPSVAKFVQEHFNCSSLGENLIYLF